MEGISCCNDILAVYVEWEHVSLDSISSPLFVFPTYEFKEGEGYMLQNGMILLQYKSLHTESVDMIDHLLHNSKVISVE